MNSVQSSDIISQLPVDETQPSYNELRIVNKLFKEHTSTINKLATEAKDSVLIGLLFVLFSLPQLDELIGRIWPSTQKSPYILIFIKVIIIMAMFWGLKHSHLARKTSI